MKKRDALTDFGGVHTGEPLEVHRPETLAQLQDTVARCVRQGRAMRARCFAHSMNGAAVPRPGEALIDLSRFRHLTWAPGGTITIGAGLAVWEVDQYVRRFGWKLPVVNDGGGPASSVGGFVSAGGIGEGCLFYGGFWETVRRLGLVLATGALAEFARDDPRFPWVFGAMGGLGLIHEVSIDLVEIGEGGRLPVEPTPHLTPGPRPHWPDHIWLTLFVPPHERDAARGALDALSREFADAWRPRADYEYYLLRRRLVPPLVFGQDSDFLAVGMWGDRTERDLGASRYLALEQRFQGLVRERGWRRYFQSELITHRRSLADYVGAETALAYAQLKRDLDPSGLLNVAMFDL